jgi:type I restriction enzyme M protein
MTQQTLSAFIWSIANLLRGDFKQYEYGKVILPFTLLRRLECVIEEKKDLILEEYEKRKNLPQNAIDTYLKTKTGLNFYNTSVFTLRKLLSDPNNLKDNLENYINSFSENARDIFEHYKFNEIIEKLEESGLLYLIVEKFASIDLHPDKVSNHQMGLIFEELIRKFAEISNETAGEHFTPRDIVRLVTALVFSTEEDLTKKGIIRSVYDPTAGTGGFLTGASEYVREINPEATIIPFGQERNPESYAICKADMMIKGEKVENIQFGDTLSDDKFKDKKFDYMLANPPFGVEWKKEKEAVVKEHEELGFAGRFGPGLPRINDGSLLFLLHLISKMSSDGSRIGIIFNGSPLFTGNAGSGESEIRRYILENDLLEAIVALPTDMFFNTGIQTYIWILSNKKPLQRKNKVQLINASSFYKPLRKSLGEKRREITNENIKEIVKLYKNFEENEYSKIFDTTDFGYRRITIERPLRLRFDITQENLEKLKQDKNIKKLTPEILETLEKLKGKSFLDKNEFFANFSKLNKTQKKLLQKYFSIVDEKAAICKDDKGNIEANSELRDYENVSLKEDIYEYFEREVKPYVSDAWINEDIKDKKDGEVGIVGYEIPFNRYFYKYTPPRSLEEIDKDLKNITQKIMEILNEI